MPALGTAERVTELFAERLQDRVLSYGGGKQKDKPAAQARLADAQVRLDALRALVDRTAERIDEMIEAGERVPPAVRADARLAAAHVVAESRSIIAGLLEASGASVHFLDHPMQRAKRDVDVLSGHVVFDHDTCRELAGALKIGLRVPITAMI
jgi:alkylation response protein AidB-like acyl-CoA dehydrogenase